MSTAGYAIHVSGLAESTTEAKLSDFFSFCGKLVSVKKNGAEADSERLPSYPETEPDCTSCFREAFGYAHISVSGGVSGGRNANILFLVLMR